MRSRTKCKGILHRRPSLALETVQSKMKTKAMRAFLNEAYRSSFKTIIQYIDHTFDSLMEYHFVKVRHFICDKVAYYKQTKYKQARAG